MCTRDQRKIFAPKKNLRYLKNESTEQGKLRRPVAFVLGIIILLSILITFNYKKKNVNAHFIQRAKKKVYKFINIKKTNKQKHS